MEFFDITITEALVRLTLALVLGAVVGAERSRVGKYAGMRTFALVSTGAALFVVTSGLIASQTAGPNFMFDPLRVASQIVVGIGFIGAGVIFFNRSAELTGLTTAAGLWVASAIGMAVGFGLYEIGLFVAFLTLFVFEVLWHIERWFAAGTKKAKVSPTHVPEKHPEEDRM